MCGLSSRIFNVIQKIVVQKGQTVPDKLFCLRQVSRISAVRAEGGVPGESAAVHEKSHILFHDGDDMILGEDVLTVGLIPLFQKIVGTVNIFVK